MVIKEKEELVNAVLKMMEGKEARATLNLDGVEFHLGRSRVEMNGKVEITFVPVEQAKKKKK